MALNLNKYFEAAKKYGLEPFQLSYGLTTETSVSVYNDEIEDQQIGSSSAIGCKAILNGKKGSFSTDFIDSSTPELVASSIARNAKFGKEDFVENYYKGGNKYKKANILSKDYKESNLSELKAVALEIAKETKASDKRIDTVEVSLSMIESKTFKANSYGVKTSEKSNNFSGYVSVVSKSEDNEPRSGGEFFFSFESLADLREKSHEAIKSAVKASVDFFKSGPVPSHKYKVVFNPSSVSSLISFYLSQLNAKTVQKHLSVFEGKLNQLISSPKLTVRHTPHTAALSSSSYDSDGAPTQDFDIISKGVLKDYFYSVETAKVDGRETNGCSVGDGNGAPCTITVKPGKLSLDQLFGKMKDGLYITDISGLNSGIDSQTLNFSLPTQGYLIEDGKIVKAVSMILIAGNLKDFFNNIIAVGNDSQLRGSAFTPSLLVGKVCVSGK
ncbi:MAG: TldD/PmbA family protein [Bacilli bacterium]